MATPKAGVTGRFKPTFPPLSAPNSLAGNDIGAAGAKALADALQENTALTALK